MRMRKKPNLVPRMERCGKGRFTVETARENPDVLFVAVERVPDAMIIAMERAVEAELPNVYFVDGDAANLPSLFAPGEVDRLYINFCDPWPGQQHGKGQQQAEQFLFHVVSSILRFDGFPLFPSFTIPRFRWV